VAVKLELSHPQAALTTIALVGQQYLGFPVPAGY